MDAPRRESAPSSDARSVVGASRLNPARAPHQWGRIDSWPTAHGAWMRKRLTVYPPGTTPSQRQALSFHHNWPVGGAIAMIVATVVLGQLWTPATAAVLSAAGYVAVGVASSRLTRVVRSASRTVEFSAQSIGDSWSIAGDIELFDELRADLIALSAKAEQGELTPVELEARWAEAFSRISPS